MLQKKLISLIDSRVETLEDKIFNEKKESTLSDSMYGYYLGYGEPTLEKRIDRLEDKMDLLLEHLKLEEKTIEKKKVLRKYK